MMEGRLFLRNGVLYYSKAVAWAAQPAQYRCSSVAVQGVNSIDCHVIAVRVLEPITCS
jgi:hypothetical protein